MYTLYIYIYLYIFIYSFIYLFICLFIYLSISLLLRFRFFSLFFLFDDEWVCWCFLARWTNKLVYLLLIYASTEIDFSGSWMSMLLTRVFYVGRTQTNMLSLCTWNAFVISSGSCIMTQVVPCLCLILLLRAAGVKLPPLVAAWQSVLT